MQTIARMSRSPPDSCGQSLTALLTPDRTDPKLRSIRRLVVLTGSDRVQSASRRARMAHLTHFTAIDSRGIGRWLRRSLFAAVMTIVAASAADAQSAIAGVVRDTSGAVLPGVTVDAS